MKTFKTIMITMIVTVIMMFVILVATGVINFESRKEQHNVQLIVDGETVANGDYSRTLGTDVTTYGHWYFGR